MDIWCDLDDGNKLGHTRYINPGISFDYATANICMEGKFYILNLYIYIYIWEYGICI